MGSVQGASHGGSAAAARGRRGGPRRACAGVSLALAALLAGSAQVSAQTVTVPAAADATIEKGSPNKNLGAEATLVLKEGGSRVLVRFDAAAITAAVGSGSLATATLQVYIGSNAANWGATGRTVDVYRLDAGWTETGATWNCATDSTPGNAQADCAAQWNGGTAEDEATDTIVVTKASQGWVQFDVTADVAAFLAGTADDGWLIEKTDEGQAGRVDLVSREGTAGLGPRLVLVSQSATVDTVPPALSITAPSQPVLVNVPSPPIAVAYSDGGSGVDLSTLHIVLDGQDLTAGCTVGAQAASCTAPPLAAGGHTVTASLSDHAGNAASASRTFQLVIGPGAGSVTLEAAADTFLTAKAPDKEHGRAAALRVAKSGPSRALVSFDLSPLVAALGSAGLGGQLVSAQLEMSIATNANNWGAAGRTVGAYALTVPWSEGAATWDCPADTNLDNGVPDCAAAWNGGTFAGSATATALMTRNLAGTVDFDVTADVGAMLAGAASDGWLIRKTDETMSGRVDFVSREAGAGTAARLVVAFQAPAADTTPPILTITSPSQGVVYNTLAAIAVAYSDGGSGVDTSTLRVTLDGGVLGCSVSSTGATCATAGVAAGSHAVAARVSDRAGNEASTSASFQLVLDGGPAISDLLPVSGSWVSRSQLSAAFSAAASPVDPASFRLLVDGIDQSAAAQVTAAGFSYVAATPWSDGQHTATVSIADGAGFSTQAQTEFIVDTVPPTLAITAPDAVNDSSLGQLTVSYGDTASGVLLASLHVLMDGTDITPACAIQAASASCAPAAQGEGSHVVSATVMDQAGNMAAANLSYEVVLTPPAVIVATPLAGALLNAASLAVAGTVAAASPVVAVTVNGSPASFSGGRFAATVTLGEGVNAILVSAVDSTGKEGTATLSVILDTQAPALSIATPSPLLTNQPAVTIAGQVSDANGIGAVTANGVAAAIVAGSFTVTVPVPAGDSNVAVEAVDQAGNRAAASVAVQRFNPPVVTITSPADLGILAATTVDVGGTVSDPAAVVTVNGLAAQVTGTSFTVTGVPLIEGSNLITATAAAGALAGTNSISVVRDLTPPHLSVDHPAGGSVLFAASTTVSGLVNDIVPGTVNAGEVAVTVNGVAAVVANRSYVAAGVPLVAGANTLTAVGVDAAGNVGNAAVTVQLAGPGTPHLQASAGDSQQAAIGTALAQPLAAQVLDATGAPVAGVTVLFRVTSGNGTLDNGRRGYAVASDSSGTARVRFTLGLRAGAGSQVVQATSPGFAGPATFVETALPGAPAQLVVDSGDQQVGIAGQQLPRPLVAVVTDQGFNRLQNVAVSFAVIKGQGSFADGQPSLSAVSDSDGRVIVTLTLDPSQGIANNVVRATMGTSSGSAQVAFTATGKVAGEPAATSISGLILDNANQPVAGVTVSILGTAIAVTSDGHGIFQIPGAPVGTIRLVVDGSTASRPGPWPGLEYVLTTIPGQDNTINMPIYLLPLDLQHGLVVDETHGGTLTLPNLPGFALTVAPGSVTFADGTHSGTISVTVVHPDKVPMVPNFGQQPLLIVTIQPAGARFEPPASMTLPNVEGLSPGAVTEMYSFDHDLGQFVSIGPATVSDDGSVITANPGVGVVKAGWHCSGFPALVGSFDLCPPCQSCDGAACVADDRLQCLLTPQGPCDAGDVCFLGRCIPTAVTVSNVAGSCSAVVNVPALFTAQSNAPDKLSWTGQPGGVPPQGMGQSYSVAFPDPGSKTVVAQCSPASASATLMVNQDCDALADPTGPQSYTLATVPGANAFGIVSPAQQIKPAYATCGAGDEVCLKLLSLGIGHAFGIDGHGDVDIDGSADPQITASNCAAVISDLTPPASAGQGGPPRTKYWSSKITTDHELVHVGQLLEQVDEPLFEDILELVDQQCAACNAPDQQTLAPQIQDLAQAVLSVWSASASDNEVKAHASSNQEYLDLIKGIRERAACSFWPSECQ
jgi:hypothetical protein